MTDTTVCFDLYTAYPVRDLIAGIEGGVGIGGVILGTFAASSSTSLDQWPF
jgi:hypothetical protein